MKDNASAFRSLLRYWSILHIAVHTYYTVPGTGNDDVASKQRSSERRTFYCTLLLPGTVYSILVLYTVFHKERREIDTIRTLSS